MNTVSYEIAKYCLNNFFLLSPLKVYPGGSCDKMTQKLDRSLVTNVCVCELVHACRVWGPTAVMWIASIHYSK